MNPNPTFQQLFNYNKVTNDKFIKLFIASHPPNIALRMFSHIVNAQMIWLQRIGKLEEAPDVWAIHIPATLDILNRRVHDIVNEILEDEEDLDKIITYSNTSGQPFQSKLSDILFHLINHSTHHRSQTALLLRQNNIEPPVSDYIKFVRE